VSDKAQSKCRHASHLTKTSIMIYIELMFHLDLFHVQCAWKHTVPT